MARRIFWIVSLICIITLGVLGGFWPYVLLGFILVGPLFLIGLYDVLQRDDNILRNYPVVGHLRYLALKVRPEIHQYFIAGEQESRPFNWEIRQHITFYAHNLNSYHPFGTVHNIHAMDYDNTEHSMIVKDVPEEEFRVLVGGDQCSKPYLASRINISAMSYGALSQTAVEAFNRAAKLGNFAQNTGEGGLSKYHLEPGGDIIFQVGTGYFSCRTKDGKFDPERFKACAVHEQVKMIELKISQGAKPSHGGVLPGVKVSKEIAAVRLVEPFVDCISPPMHSAFSTPIGMMEFIQKLRELSGGKPVGFKICIGKFHEFLAIIKAMLQTKILPDFITIDGAEGGTGAAPLEFTNYIGTPLDDALIFAHNALVGTGLRDKIRLIASGKMTNGFDMLSKAALGADMFNMARSMMFSLGCVQSRRCHNNTCPTGITTQNPALYYAVVPHKKAPEIVSYYERTKKRFLLILGACGLEKFSNISPDLIRRRIDVNTTKTYGEIYHYLQPNELLEKPEQTPYAASWARAQAEIF